MFIPSARTVPGPFGSGLGRPASAASREKNSPARRPLLGRDARRVKHLPCRTVQEARPVPLSRSAPSCEPFIKTAKDAQDALAADDVRVIVERSPGGIRIGGYGGLTRLRDGQFTRWTEHDGLPSNSVRSIYEDSEASSGSEATTAAWAASKTASLPAIACAKGCSITASFRFSKMRMATFG